MEERERAYKQGLTERLEPRIPSGERVEAVAVCQVGMPPWAQMVPMVLGIAVLVVSVFADALPGWVGVFGAVLVAATTAGVSSLVCALIWRAQLIEAWRKEHGRPTRDW